MNSLIISDKEKYGEDSPGCCVPASPGEKTKPEDRKSAPTMDLTGPQVEAFGLDGTANLEQVGYAKICFKVKSVRAGESYGDSITTKKQPTKVTIQITDVEPLEDESPGETDAEEAGEDPAEEASETQAEEDAEEETEDAGDEPAKTSKKKKAKESEKADYVSPDEAALPE